MSTSEPPRWVLDPALEELVTGTLGAVHRWSPLGAGVDHRAWQADTEDGIWVIREPAADGDLGDPAVEVRLTQAVRAAGVRWAPEIRALAPLPGQPTGVTAHRFVPGRSLLDVLAARDVAERELVRLGRLLGTFVRDVGELAPEGLALPVDRPDPADWLATTAESLGAVRARLDGQLVAAVNHFLSTPPPRFPATDALTVAHNDLGAEHVLVDGALGITGIIDWSDAAVTDPAHDLGCVLRDLGDAAFRAATVAWATRAAPSAQGAAHSAEQAPAAHCSPLPVRALWFARCLVVEDLAFAHERRPEVLGVVGAQAHRLFVADRRR